MRLLDLFSGIGAFSLGLERAGMKTVAFCEVNPFCRRVLAKHWPEVPILGDIETVLNFPVADVICGGFPCQNVSRAGKRAGITGAHSGLYRELVRAIRLVRPQHAIVENVAALLDNGMGTVLGDLAESGYDIEWDCVPAEAIGAPHERDRIFIVAHAKGQDDGVCDASTPARQEPKPGNRIGSLVTADATSDGRRPPDSFAGIRDATCRDAAYTVREGLQERQGEQADARSQLPAAERTAIVDVWQSQWPSEPALLGMDDGVADRVERVRSIGNTLIPQIPELIGRAILAREADAHAEAAQ